MAATAAAATAAVAATTAAVAATRAAAARLNHVTPSPFPRRRRNDYVGKGTRLKIDRQSSFLLCEKRGIAIGNVKDVG